MGCWREERAELGLGPESRGRGRQGSAEEPLCPWTGPGPWRRSGRQVAGLQAGGRPGAGRAVAHVPTPWLGLGDPLGATGARHVAAAVEASVPARTLRLPRLESEPGKKEPCVFIPLGFIYKGRKISVWIVIVLWERSRWRESHCSVEGIIHLGVMRARGNVPEDWPPGTGRARVLEAGGLPPGKWGSWKLPQDFRAWCPNPS